MTKFLEKLRSLPESQKIVIFVIVMGIASLIVGFIGMRFIMRDFARIKDVGKNMQLPAIELPDELKNLGTKNDQPQPENLDQSPNITN